MNVSSRWVLGTPLQVSTYKELTADLQSRIGNAQPFAVDFTNTHIVTMRRHDSAFRTLTSCFDYFIPDGMPLIWCMNRQGAKLYDRVYGPTFMRHCLLASPAPFTHYFLGGSDRCVAALKESFLQENPQIQIIGCHNGYFGPEQEEEILEEINRLSPDFIWLGLGTPKQQDWIYRHKSRIRRGILLAVGFAFDVNAGLKPDAPPWMQRRGLTWAFRLWSEPLRLGPRYFKYNSLFLFYLLRDALRGRAFAPRESPSWREKRGVPDQTESAKKTSVLIIVENLPVPLDRRVWQEACALRDAGYEVAVICPRMRGYSEPQEIIEGIHVYRHWISEEAGRFLGYFREYSSALFGEWWSAIKAWRRHRFKVIHLCNPPDLLFLIALPFKMLGVRIIYDVHDVWPEMFEAKFGRRGFFYWIVRLAERLTYAIADVVLATNESVRNVALRRGRKPSESVFVVRTAPKFGTASLAADPALKQGRTYLVGYVGVMGDADGVDLLLEAIDYIVHKLNRRDIQFLLMGTGPEYPKLIEQRNRLNLQEYIDMPGRVTNEFLFTALRTIDLGVSCDPINTYNQHCTMNKVLEYMAFGKAQIMFDLKEGRESAGPAALYVERNSPQDFGESLVRLLGDASRREEMGRIGIERIEKELNWEKSVAQLLRAYDRALSQG